MSVKLLIAEHDQALRNKIRKMVCSEDGREIVSLASDGQDAILGSVQYHPQVALIAYDLPGISGPQVCEVLSSLVPDVMPILFSGTKTDEQIEIAMRCGARAFVTETMEPGRLNRLIDRIAEVQKRRDSQEFLQWKDPSRFPRIITVTGAKGGVGKTTLSVNLAAALAEQMPGSVVLLDVYTQFGDVAHMLNLTPKLTVADMAAISPEPEPELIQDCIIKHSSGLHVLVTSIDPLPLDTISPQFLDKLLYALRRMYTCTVIDTPPILNQTTMQLMTHSNLVLLVANLFDLTTVADTKKLYDTLLNENVTKECLRVILNRAGKVNKLSMTDIAGMFDTGLLAHVPNDSRLVTAINQGVPLILNDGNSPFRKSILELSSVITQAHNKSAIPEETSTWQTFFRRKKTGVNHENYE